MGQQGDPTPATARPAAERRPRRVRRIALAAAGLGLAGVIGAEVAGRVVFGLGDPPLFIRDERIEYLYKPSSRYRYRHHDVLINSHSMRSGEFGATKASADELRVLVIGDSIVAGGGKIDQKDLATERLGAMLGASTKRPVVVGNISAPSWGPPNQLAYVQRFGLFDADVVLLVLNSGDVDDVPGLERLGSAWPRSHPLLAVQEPAERLVERLAPGLAERLGILEPPAAGSGKPGAERRAQAARALAELVEMIRAKGAAVGAVQYWGLRELRPEGGGVPDPGHDELLGQLRGLGVRVWQASEGPSRFEADATLFLDGVHPSPKGQERLAGVLASAVAELLSGPGARGGGESEKR